MKISMLDEAELSPTLSTYRTAVSPTLDLLCHEDFNVGGSGAESNIKHLYDSSESNIRFIVP